MENKKSLRAAVAIYCFSATATLQAAINPLIQTMINYYSDASVESVRLIGTIPSMAAMIFSIVAGGLVGKKLSYKMSGIIGALLYIVCGVVPVFWDKLNIILISRFMVGIATGMYAIRNSYLIKMYEGKQRNTLLGLEGAISNAGNVLGTLAVGILGATNWRNGFMLYFIMIIPLLSAIFLLKEPEKVVVKPGEVKEKAKFRITAPIWILALFMIFATMTLYPLLSGMSTVVAFRNMGTLAQAALCLSCYTAGGVFAGLTFGLVSSKIGSRWMMLYACVLVIIGQTVTLFTTNLIMMGAFTAVCGVGYLSFIPSIMTRIPNLADKDNIPISTTLMWSSIQAGVFLSAWWIALSKLFPFGSYDVEKSWWVCIAAYIVMALLCLFWNPDKDVKTGA